jgi:hypothetical protein
MSVELIVSPCTTSLCDCLNSLTIARNFACYRVEARSTRNDNEPGRTLETVFAMPIDIDPVSNCETVQLDDIQFFINDTVMFYILS